MMEMKFRKLSRVLISLSLLALIAVSLISVPVSAVDPESVIGTWVFNNTLVLPNSSMSENSFGDIAGVFHLVDTDTKEIYDAPIGFVTIYYNASNGVRINFDGDGNNNGNYGYPTLSIINYEVRQSENPNTTAYYNSSTDGITADEYKLLRTITIDSYTPSGADAQALVDFLEANATKIVPPSPTLLENILGTFSEVGSWIGTIISSLVALFWSVETASLTFLGILSVAGLAFSVIMLLFGIVSRFVGFSS